MRVYVRPQFWWRAAIVACGVAGLLMGEQRIVYYTCQSNLITLGFFAGTLYWMIKRRTVAAPAPRLRGAVTLWIMITCLISHFLLTHGKNPLPGLAAADPATATLNRSLFLLHYVVPLMVLADWVFFGPHRLVRRRDIPLWILYPLGYGLAIEFRAALVPTAPIQYPYFFLDPTDRGYDWVAGQFVELAVIFAVLGAAVVGLDRLASLGRRRGEGPPAQPVGADPVEADREPADR
ncbi:Pr6Pr family membrane protein [Actinoplanes sp. NPDC026619]|uniref:Pr6Pr family membrane protein n=1 Tax=Actinoplanes sp. NPDC026619 TaxID=3155798 RepID=UPI0033F88947